MPARTLAHLSDLHLGRSPATDAAAAELCRALLQARVDHVLVTGDVTHRGRRTELDTFRRVFEPFADRGALTVVPGNHDRLGEDAGAQLMFGHRVLVHEEPGLYVVLLDSTGPHNRAFLRSHGTLCRETLREAHLALAAAPGGVLRVVALHHHPLPLPGENVWERAATRLGLPHAGELALGRELIRVLGPRCDLVLHGHRHVPRRRGVSCGAHRVGVYNAGSSTELGQARIFTHREGRLLHRPIWLGTDDLRAPVRVGPAVPAYGAASAL